MQGVAGVGSAEVFEAELARNPYSLQTWLAYLTSSAGQPARVRLALYDRAVSHLPGSYKLWIAYVQEAVKDVRCLSLQPFLSPCRLRPTLIAPSHPNPRTHAPLAGGAPAAGRCARGAGE